MDKHYLYAVEYYLGIKELWYIQQHERIPEIC